MACPRSLGRRPTHAFAWARLGAPVLAALIACAGPAVAQTPALPVSPTEQVNVAVPQGWQKVFEGARDGVEMTQFTPPGQTANDWRDLLALQVIDNAVAPKADGLRSAVRENLAARCDKVTAGDLQGAMSNGYSSAFFVIGCHRDRASGLGELRLIRMIRGINALYVMERAWKTQPYGEGGPPLDPAVRDEAMGVLQAFSLCDPARPGHPCPSGR